MLSHRGPARPWRVSSRARGTGRRGGPVAAVVKALPCSGAGRGAPAVPASPQPAASAAQLSGREVTPGPSVVGSSAGTASDGLGTGVPRECCLGSVSWFSP